MKSWYRHRTRTAAQFHVGTLCRAAAVLVLAFLMRADAAAQEAAVITGTVRNGTTGTAVEHAAIRAAPAQRTYTARPDGTYRLLLNEGRHVLRVSAPGFAPLTRTIEVAAGDSVSIDFVLEQGAVPLEEIVVVGTRRTDRTLADAPVPVDVVSLDMLESTGATETWQQLQRLLPSANAPHIPLGDNHMRPVTLRGLAPHHVLVLVNGKRRHPAAVLLAGPSVPFTALTDLNAIPASAIDRIEVLRDGAAAQYGSDAIAGVVNVVLKAGPRRDARASFSQVYSSEGGRDFRDGRVIDFGTSLGVGREDGSHLTISGVLRTREATNRAYPDARQQYFTGDERNGEPPRISSHVGNGRTRELSLLATAARPLGTTAELYGVAGAADRNGEAPDGFFRRPLDNRTVRGIHPNGFMPIIESSIRDLSVLGGARGSARGWRWDVSSGWGGNRVAYDVRNSNNVSLGLQSPTDFDAGALSMQQWTTNLDAARDLLLRGLPLALAAGAELRAERYRIEAGESDSWRDGGVAILDGPMAGRPAPVGAQGLPGFRPVDEGTARRTTVAAYVEAEGRPTQRLLLQTAGRVEHYSDFGSTADGKVALRYQLPLGLAARGSLSTGFRAPALSQAHFASTRSVVQLIGGVSTFLTVRTFPVHTAEAQLMGAQPLRPERSLNRSAGIVLERPRLPAISVDYYRVTIDDRINLLPSVTAPEIVQLFEDNGMRGLGGGNYFTNGIDTRTDGVDVIASHALAVRGSGVVRVLAGYSRARTRVTRVAELPPELAPFESAQFNRTARGIIEQGQPRETLMLNGDYSVGRLRLNVLNQRSGPTAQLDQTNPERDQHVRPKWITDVRLGVQLRTRVQLAVGAANVFDTYPDEWLDFREGLSGQGFSMQGIFRYPGALTPYGMTGRTIYAQVVYR